MIVLRQNSGLPPGGLVFKDSRTGKLWNDMSAFLDDRVTEVIRFRQQNPSIYDIEKDADLFDRKKVAQEITDQNYARLGNLSSYFIESSGRSVPSYNTNTQGRCSCGVELEPRYCPTCQGRRVIGYRCPKCERTYESN